jgi:hypothetical protein
MQLPNGIEEQYIFFTKFLEEPYKKDQILHIHKPFYETSSILTIAIQDWEKRFISDRIQIQYFESDTCIKRIITMKQTNITKRIILDMPSYIQWKIV